MRYYTELLNELRAGRTAPVYLFFGPETYLRGEAVKRMREMLLPGEAGEFNFNLLDGRETSMADIISLACATPFFAGKRLVLVHDATLFTGKKGDAPNAGDEPSPLLEYLAAPNPHTCLVFDAGESVDKSKKIYKKIAGMGKVVEFSLLKTGELSAWLDKRARLAGKSLAQAAAREILARVGNSLQALSVEINKLISYVGERDVITREDVEAVISSHPEEDIFAVLDAIGEKNPTRALAGIHRLFRQKHPPQLILSMAARQIRLILRTGEAIESGTRFADIADKIGIHPYVAKKMSAQQKNFDRGQLTRSLYWLHKLDVAIKSGQQEFLPGMEIFILDICRPAFSPPPPKHCPLCPESSG